MLQSKRESYWSNETRYIIFVSIGLRLGTQREHKEHKEHREHIENRKFRYGKRYQIGSKITEQVKGALTVFIRDSIHPATASSLMYQLFPYVTRN